MIETTNAKQHRYRRRFIRSSCARLSPPSMFFRGTHDLRSMGIKGRCIDNAVARLSRPAAEKLLRLWNLRSGCTDLLTIVPTRFDVMITDQRCDHYHSPSSSLLLSQSPYKDTYRGSTQHKHIENRRPPGPDLPFLVAFPLPRPNPSYHGSMPFDTSKQ